ncbi:MAG: hypothetical protein A2542_02940 [Parcubacteria group bacterium RIFOXYD2_FULL_52_8]|nr:MAG: hypothetical protein A2542_02940 [Parcubacteria group bacterium RIFOXYD2_FULL_52_8]
MEQDTHKRRARLLEWSLTIAIVVVLNLLINVGLQLVVKEPTYEKFCPQTQILDNYSTKDSCLAVGGQWIEGSQAYPPKKVPAPAPTRPDGAFEGTPSYCNPSFTCSQQLQEASKVYNRNVFLVLITAGAVSLLIGFFVTASTAVSLGFTWGGVLSLVVGSVRYWSDMNEYLRFVLLLLVLGVLIWLGIKKLNDLQK